MDNSNPKKELDSPKPNRMTHVLGLFTSLMLLAGSVPSVFAMDRGISEKDDATSPVDTRTRVGGLSAARGERVPSSELAESIFHDPESILPDDPNTQNTPSVQTARESLSALGHRLDVQLQLPSVVLALSQIKNEEESERQIIIEIASAAIKGQTDQVLLLLKQYFLEYEWDKIDDIRQLNACIEQAGLVSELTLFENPNATTNYIEVALACAASTGQEGTVLAILEQYGTGPVKEHLGLIGLLELYKPTYFMLALKTALRSQQASTVLALLDTYGPGRTYSLHLKKAIKMGLKFQQTQLLMDLLKKYCQGTESPFTYYFIAGAIDANRLDFIHTIFNHYITELGVRQPLCGPKGLINGGAFKGPQSDSIPAAFSVPAAFSQQDSGLKPQLRASLPLDESMIFLQFVFRETLTYAIRLNKKEIVDQVLDQYAQFGCTDNISYLFGSLLLPGLDTGLDAKRFQLLLDYLQLLLDYCQKQGIRLDEDLKLKAETAIAGQANHVP